jgi:hypothetical protein
VCDKTCIFLFFPIINKYFLMAKRFLILECPSYVHWDLCKVPVIFVKRTITDAPWYVPNAVIKRDLKVLSVRQEVRNYRVTYHQSPDNHPIRLAKSLFRRTHHNRRLVDLSGITLQI